MDKGATLSPCRKYRYQLWRWWDTSLPKVMFVGLNPSTADESEDDHTIRRCINFAKSWGYGGLFMVNLFAYRTKDPAVMMATPDPVGEFNDYELLSTYNVVDLAVACWGTNGSFMDRDKAVREMLPDLHVLVLTKHGHPGHPARLSKSLKPFIWTQSDA